MERIHCLEKEIAEIRKTLLEKERELYALKKEWYPLMMNNSSLQKSNQQQFCMNNTQVQLQRLPKWAIERYSRQILLQDIGVHGQEKICAAKVLIIGAGGLGCPAAVYLAAAGVGEIGIVDYDTVDVTNIHRQILHSESDEHMSKAESAADTLRSINSRITVTPYNVQLDSSNALEIAAKYDIILDCTDNVPTRYLLNDVCVLSKLPLISGSALKMEGQITTYGYRAEKNPNEKDPQYMGPCYRCVFPAPPSAETVGSCASNGVAGPVPAVIGSLQALEAIKYIVGQTHQKLLVGRLLLFDGEDMLFRTVRLRPQNPECAACSKNATITHLLDYETFCRAQAKEKKKQEARLKAQRRLEEKERRMTGRSYLGFRVQHDEKRKWVQDVPKSGRKIGPGCKSGTCSKSSTRNCSEFNEEKRREIFNYFWNELDWKGKKRYVRSLVDSVPPKRRRVKHKGEVSRKGDSKVYHLMNGEKRLSVCRSMFLSTFDIKEAMVRTWLIKMDVPKKAKQPVKSINVETYIDSLPKILPKCQLCRHSNEIQYINLDDVKNIFQLHNQYVRDMKAKGLSPASRKTFTKVFASKNIRIFKPKNDTDVCDIVSQHNVLPSIPMNSYQNVLADVQLDKDSELVPNVECVQNIANNYYYNSVQW